MLHHYTTVNTLALILQHRTLRFTRLDQFDDVTEGRSLGAFPAGARMFASCWSAADEESIPQWAMYGDGMKGIRLSVRPDPFVWSHINIDWHENFSVRGLDAPFSTEEMLAAGVTLTPTIKMRSTFGQLVRYVSDVEAALQRHVSVGPAGEMTFWGEGHEIAFYKSAAWEFQKEYRFVLLASPGPAEPYHGDVPAYLEARRRWQADGVNLISAIPDRLHIDLKLAPDALASAEIVVGPLAPSGTMEIVQSLVARFAAGATVRASSLSGTIRPK